MSILTTLRLSNIVALIFKPKTVPTSQVIFKTYEVSTTDATPTTIATIPIPTDSVITVTAAFTALRTGGTAGSAGDSAGGPGWVTSKNNSGTASTTTPMLDFFAPDQMGVWDVGDSVSGANLLIQVTGAIDNNIDWEVVIMIKEQIPPA